MKTFIITETRPATYIWKYEVEAEDENEAMFKIMNGDIEPVSSSTEVWEDVDSDYEVVDEIDE